ncbi:helix-turn-helix domain-containing protein [Halanaerobium kushneri]|uniref:Transcriptional regulator, XRE family with cupin sensor n=1 Tax=Halanaerobium kushneri TaxID=56779 RepID=A0A1N6S1B8_9FIRM|nr:XRE family transcriptional regulator [Halanaerobium kushneri]SIQ34855.1 transcriptional regulator, XRE family with cupin sensor [Halanaerobium kushneri]
MVTEKYSYVGEKIKLERLNHDLTLQELADETGLSVSFLSQLENGKIAPSLKALDKIASFFSIHIANLFVKPQSLETYHFSNSDHIEVENDNKFLKFLMPKLEEMEVVLLTLEDQNENFDYTTHKGVEFVYVLEGKVVLDFSNNQEKLICEEGDSMIYIAQRPHRILNAHSGSSKCFIINLEKSESINIK